LGVVLDGLPAGLAIDPAAIQDDLDRRRPGASPFSSPRKEPDQVEILSGLTKDNLTNGAPLAMLIRSVSFKSSDYAPLARLLRPGHADYSCLKKWDLPLQPGGGRSSGRETAARVAAGAVARIMLKEKGVLVRAAASAIGPVKAESRDWAFALSDPLRFLDPQKSEAAQSLVLEASAAGDSVGSVVEFEALGVRPGLGAPVFDKLEALLGRAFLSIGAVKAVEFGEGVAMASMRGSEANDPLGSEGPLSNRHGGILGGISSGLPITARLFVKPTPSISLRQKTVDLDGNPAEIEVKGRHDPCLAPRLAPVAEAMGLLVLADLYLSPPDRWPSG
jgi:chorismate synthase